MFPTSSNVPTYLYRNIVTLLALVDSESIIASYVNENAIPGSRDTSSQYIELPVTLPVSVSLCPGVDQYRSRHTEDEHSSPMRELAYSPRELAYSPRELAYSSHSPYQNMSFDNWEKRDDIPDDAEYNYPTFCYGEESIDSETQPLTTADFRKRRTLTQPLVCTTTPTRERLRYPVRALGGPASCSDGVSLL